MSLTVAVCAASYGYGCSFNAGLGEGTEARDGEDIDGTLTWEDVAWLRSVTTLPLVVKGVMTPEDTVLAAKAGCVSQRGSWARARAVDSLPCAR